LRFLQGKVVYLYLKTERLNFSDNLAFWKPENLLAKADAMVYPWLVVTVPDTVDHIRQV